MTLDKLTPIVKNFSDKHAALRDACVSLNDAIEALKRQHLTTIRRLVAATAGAHVDLTAAIEESPELFKSPRTHCLFNVKFGLAKGKGKIAFEDPARVVELIHKHYSDTDAQDYLHIKETPNKDALEKLPVGELKKLACTLSESGDKVVITVTDGGVDKIVKALLTDATKDTDTD